MDGPWCGQVVSMLASYSDEVCSNPTDVYSFSDEFVLEKNENKQKEAGVSPFLKNSAESVSRVQIWSSI